jgi:hypothetical protein
MNKRPIAVTVIAFVYILTGVIGATYHLRGFKLHLPFQYDIVWAEITSLVAILCGAYMLRGHNWARWLALAWIGFHVILSAFHTLTELAIHSLFFGILAFLLFRPASTHFFQGGKAKEA